MRSLGVLTALFGAAALTGAVYLGIQSIPDVKRYLAIRRM
jgi:hypothetical protein